MKRFIDYYLTQWAKTENRKPLLLRGARQVGKTYAARHLGRSFHDFFEINFESYPKAASFFEADLDPKRIIRELSLSRGKPIIPGKTLLFFDEIQAAPKVLLALRYFYEMLPEQHLIAAGSLLDFTIQELGMPVGRVTSLYVYPLSFIEFMYALGHDLLIEEILQHKPTKALSDTIHDKLLKLLGHYLAIGGMPEAVFCWVKTQDPFACFEVHISLVDTYRQDFYKYAKNFQIKYVSLLFDQIPLHVGRKFKYSAIEGEFRKRELAPALELLATAGVIHKVLCSAGQGIPLGAQVDPENFKLIFLDVAIAQTILGLNLGAWITDPLEQFVNKGEFIEAFVGQEILAYAFPKQRPQLYYWQRLERGSQAEIDYLVQQEETVIPIEVKSGAGTALKSMHLFLESHPKSPYGIRFSTLNYSVFQKLHSYPLYAIGPVMQK